MKNKLLAIALLCIIKVSSQEKIGRPFITGSLNFTLGLNEHYTFSNDDDETLLEPAALFIRTGFGYEFKRRVAVSFNVGFDYHWNYAVSAFPTYTTLRLNITENKDDAFFVETSFGKMWRPTNRYSDGNYYGFGLGTQISTSERTNVIVKLDFHRKEIAGFDNNRIDSISLGIGFSFF